MAHQALELPQRAAATRIDINKIGRSIRRFLGKLVFNLIPFAIVAVFFWIQIQIGDSIQGLGGKATLVVVTVAEIGLVFVWSLFL